MLMGPHGLPVRIQMPMRRVLSPHVVKPKDVLPRTQLIQRIPHVREHNDGSLWLEDTLVEWPKLRQIKPNVPLILSGAIRNIHENTIHRSGRNQVADVVLRGTMCNGALKELPASKRIVTHLPPLPIIHSKQVPQVQYVESTPAFVLRHEHQRELTCILFRGDCALLVTTQDRALHDSL